FGIEDDHFAIDPGPLDRKSGEILRYLGKGPGPVVAVARNKTCVPAFDAAYHPVAVVFDLVDPLVARWRALDKGRADRRTGGGHCRFFRATNGCRARLGGARFRGLR